MEKVMHLSNSKDLDPLMERIGDAHFVLLGEASHGTHEFHTWRSAISRRLITEKGFDFIGVEGDWPDCYRVNRYIKGYADNDKRADEVLSYFTRWPTWMWANWETAAMISWLKEHNKHCKANRRVGFYGLDVYSLWESLEALISYLQKTDPAAARTAEKTMHYFRMYGKDEKLSALHSLPYACRRQVARLLKEISKKAPFYNHDPEASLNTAQNAHIAVEAEKFYRSMITFNDTSWNIRDLHMMDTLKRLVEFHDPGSKVIVWAHNTHIGDARFCNMKRAGLLNLGQLVRQRYGWKDVVLVGSGAYSGKVMAGRNWNSPAEEMEMPVAGGRSAEELLHLESPSDRLIIFDRKDRQERFGKLLLQRGIGVVYHPEEEKYNYTPSILNARYDAFLYFDQTRALHAFGSKADDHFVPSTYPFEF